MAAQRVNSRKKLYSIIAIAVVVSLGAAFLLSLELDVKLPFLAQKPNAQPQPSTATKQPSPTPTLSTATNPNNSPSPTNSSQNYLITKDEAISIAMPYINQYIEQNNRIVTNLTATFHEGDGWGTTPVWDVFASFDRTEYTMHDPQYWVTGYEVVIFAGNGKIDYQQAVSVM